MEQFVPIFTWFNRIKDKGDDVLPVLCVFLVIACYFDYRRCRIPNLLLGALLLYGLLQSFINGGVQDFALFMGITLLVMLVFYPFFKIGCIGAGDVKLFGICAGFFPLGKILLFLFFSLLISAGISLFRMLQNNNLQERFFYLGEYLLDVFQSRRFKLYLENMRGQAAGICLSGPILCSALLYWGGFY